MTQCDEEQLEEEQNSHEDLTLTPSARVKLHHPSSQVLGKVTDKLKTRRQIREEVSHLCYLSQVEPRNMKEVLNDDSWVNAMHEELEQ